MVIFDQLLGRQSQTQTQTQTQTPLPPAASSVPVARSISSTPINFDLNADGKINSADIAVLLNDWRNHKKTLKLILMVMELLIPLTMHCFGGIYSLFFDLIIIL